MKYEMECHEDNCNCREDISPVAREYRHKIDYFREVLNDIIPRPALIISKIALIKVRNRHCHTTARLGTRSLRPADALRQPIFLHNQKDDRVRAA